MTPLLDVDAGEIEDEPAELYELADLVHVACGGHAGDEASMTRVIRACTRAGTRVGAHPSYVDREGFGRRPIAIGRGLLASQIEAQCGRLLAIARREGATIEWVKPHGALYHVANQDLTIASACIEGARRALGSFAIVASAGGGLEQAARATDTPFLREAFADRATRADGSLVPRGDPGAMIEDPRAAADRARALALREDVDAICVHGDTKDSLAIARAVRATLGPRR